MIHTNSGGTGQASARAPKEATLPVEYEEAIAALIACTNIDEAKYWDNKADALAAWAKIYRNGEAERKARILKLHAYRRMGELARELRPHTVRLDGGTGPGPTSLLREQGLAPRSAAIAVQISAVDPKYFNAEVQLPRPRSPMSFIQLLRKETRGEAGEVVSALNAFHRFCAAHDSDAAAQLIKEEGAPGVREIAVVLLEWLDNFEQRLPTKGKRK